MGYVILLWHSLSLPYNYFDPAMKLIKFNLVQSSVTFLFLSDIKSYTLDGTVLKASNTSMKQLQMI